MFPDFWWIPGAIGLVFILVIVFGVGYLVGSF